MKKTIENLASAEVEKTDGDYVKDGLLYCGKCHTPKEFRIKLWGVDTKVKCLCKCGTEAREAEERKREARATAERVQRMKRRGFADESMERWTFDRDDHSNKKLSSVARKYVENFAEMKQKGKGLLLYGTVGTGKSFITACIINALIEKGHPCMMTNLSRIANVPINDRQSYIDYLSMYDLIAIDDLASERDTEYMNEMIHSVIDARYRSGKPLIVTTNLTADEMKHPADIRKDRLYSRLFEMCVPIEVKGRDKRKQKLKEEYKAMEEILGL